MTAFLRHVPVDPADHPAAIPDPHALGGLFERGRALEPEQRLWQAVLLAALADALTPYARAAFARREARDFLDAPGDRHRALLCDLAGIDPNRFERCWRRLKSNPTPPAGLFRAAHRKKAP